MQTESLLKSIQARRERGEHVGTGCRCAECIEETQRIERQQVELCAKFWEAWEATH